MSCSGSRKGKGRQKVKMAKIENETNLQVTFSKRRAGLFKKASELSTLCGAETAVVVFSPGNKAHSFGHPNVDSVANRFLNQNVPQMGDADKLLEAHQKATIQQQNMKLAQLHKQLEFEQKRAQELERVRKQCGPPDLDKLSYRQLEQLKGALLRFRHQLQSKVYKAAVAAQGQAQAQAQAQAEADGVPSSSRVRSNEGTSTSNASAIRYDPMATESCPTIAYSSTATTPTADH